MAFFSSTKESSNEMIQAQLIQRGIKDEKVLTAMTKVPRHHFVSPESQSEAYGDFPLAIGYGQTISQPYIVALMVESAQIKDDDKVLEIGTGSGYQAAILSLLAQEVYTIEVVDDLGEIARRRLKNLGYKNVKVKNGDGYFGWPEFAPFDVILITAASREVPQPLLDQLSLDGRLIMPFEKGPFQQELIAITKTKEGLQTQTICPVSFVPFTRKEEG
ncbi:MAG: protein-L-isoaspartate O-methyltransferase [Alphaproteobacteria bacterium]|nr:MAG: protein-L-isoaspartate O-methyltransferase [Alphaproteobacteria bacterium]